MEIKFEVRSEAHNKHGQETSRQLVFGEEKGRQPVYALFKTGQDLKMKLFLCVNYRTLIGKQVFRTGFRTKSISQEGHL